MDIIYTGYLAIFGFLVYVIFQSLNIAERFSHSFKQPKSLTKELRIQNVELKKVKENAENSDKLKTVFLANMSHEIRTPMNAILEFSNLLAKNNINDERRKKLSHYIIKSGNSLLQLLNDIIDLSKIEAGQLEINKSVCNINALCNELELIYIEKENSDITNNTVLRFEKNILVIRNYILTEIY